MWSKSIPTLNPYEATREILAQKTTQAAEESSKEKNA